MTSHDESGRKKGHFFSGAEIGKEVRKIVQSQLEKKKCIIIIIIIISLK